MKPKLIKYAAQKAEECNCGLLPFWLLSDKAKFHSACAKHDKDYVRLRHKALEAVVQHAPINVKQFLTMMFKAEILTADLAFFTRMKRVVEDQPWWNRWAYAATRRLFMVIVKTLGWQVWLTNTIKKYEEEK